MKLLFLLALSPVLFLLCLVASGVVAPLAAIGFIGYLLVKPLTNIFK